MRACGRPTRHARTRCGHPRLSSLDCNLAPTSKAWMAVTSTAMTRRVAPFTLIRPHCVRAPSPARRAREKGAPSFSRLREKVPRSCEADEGASAFARLFTFRVAPGGRLGIHPRQGCFSLKYTRVRQGLPVDPSSAHRFAAGTFSRAKSAGEGGASRMAKIHAKFFRPRRQRQKFKRLCKALRLWH